MQLKAGETPGQGAQSQRTGLWVEAMKEQQGMGWSHGRWGLARRWVSQGQGGQPQPEQILPSSASLYSKSLPPA